MKNRILIASLAAAGLIAASPLLLPSSASASAPAASENSSAVSDQSIIRIVDEAIDGLRQVHAARLAIFNGETDAAIRLAKAAEQDFAAVEQHIGSHRLARPGQSDSDDAYVPFDMAVGLAEGFVPSEENSGKLEQANQHFQQGKQRDAVDLLRNANIDVEISAGLLPARASLSQVRDAIRLLGESEYYQANLALKALEDAVVFETYSADTLPLQGAKS